MAFHSIPLKIKLCTKVIDNRSPLSVRSMVTSDPCHAMTLIQTYIHRSSYASNSVNTWSVTRGSCEKNLVIFKNKHLYSASIIIYLIYRKFISHNSDWYNNRSYEKRLSIEQLQLPFLHKCVKVHVSSLIVHQCNFVGSFVDEYFVVVYFWCKSRFKTFWKWLDTGSDRKMLWKGLMVRMKHLFLTIWKINVPVHEY